MRSSILLMPRTAFHSADKACIMATKSTQRLTFYEDLYLKPHKKTASLPCRIHKTQPRQPEKRQSASSNRSERSSRSSGCKSPENNPLLDSPPSSRQLSLAGRNSKGNHSRASSHDDTNNNIHPIHRPSIKEESSTSSTNNYANMMFFSTIQEGQNSHYSHLISPPPLRRSRTMPDDHVYEVIPAQKPKQISQPPPKKLYDDSNYLVTSAKSPYPQKADQVRMRRSRDNVSGSTSNLRAMRRMGRSVDSISRCVNGNKLRSQSTILAPQLWMKSPSKAPLASAASCGNLTEQTLEFGRLSHGLTVLDKENTSPDQLELRKGEVDLRTISTSSSNHSVSPRHKRSEDNVSQKSSNSSLHSSSSRNSHTNRRYYHRHSSSYAGSTSSAYENMDQLYRAPEGSNYVNIQEFQPVREKELNYADLDFTTVKQQNPKPTSSTRNSRSATPSKQSHASQAGVSIDVDDSHVEYTQINIHATQAARLACAEHQIYRQQRHIDSASSS